MDNQIASDKQAGTFTLYNHYDRTGPGDACHRLTPATEWKLLILPYAGGPSGLGAHLAASTTVKKTPAIFQPS